MKVVIVPAALVELQAAAAFYTAQVNVDLARAFVDEFDRVVKLIASSPELGAIFRGNRRRFQSDSCPRQSSGPIYFGRCWAS